MSAATEALRELKIGTQMYAQSVAKRIPNFNPPKWSDIRENKFLFATMGLFGVAGAVAIGVFSYAFSYSDDQTASEKAGVEEEARVRVIGFKSVESAVHGSGLPFFTGPDTATIELEGGESCTVEFKHDTSGPMGIPMGAEVTSWRDCPLIKQD